MKIALFTEKLCSKNMKIIKLFPLLPKAILIPIAISLIFYESLAAFAQNNSPINKTPNSYPSIFQPVTPLKNNPKKLVLQDVVILLLANNTEI